MRMMMQPFDGDDYEQPEPDPDDFDTMIDEQNELFAHGAYDEDDQ